MAEEWEILNDEQEMWDLVDLGMSPSQSPNSIALWETVDIEVKLSETLDTGTKAIAKFHSEKPNTIDNVQVNLSNKTSVDAVKALNVTLDVTKERKLSDTLDVGMTPLDNRDLSQLSAVAIKPPKTVVKPPKTVDKELAALLTKWGLDDAAKALAKHGWTKVSLLKQLNPDKHMDELGLSSGQACGLIALLQVMQEVPFTVSVSVHGIINPNYKVEVLPSDSVGDLKAKVLAKFNLLPSYNLFLSNEKLMEDRSLSSYNIQQNTSLKLKRNS
jgi:hypothetical protein